MARKSTRESIVNVRNALSVTSPKYCDKTIKKAFLKCAIHYGLHGDKNQFHALFKELPRGVWNERLKSFYEFVVTIPQSEMRGRYPEVRTYLDDIIKIPNYKSASVINTKNREGFSYKNINTEIISALKHAEDHGNTGNLKQVIMRIPLSARTRVIKKITEISSYKFHVNGRIYDNGGVFTDSKFYIGQAKMDGNIRVIKGRINEKIDLNCCEFYS